jgi:hypothetical protein
MTARIVICGLLPILGIELDHAFALSFPTSLSTLQHPTQPNRLHIPSHNTLSIPSHISTAHTMFRPGGALDQVHGPDLENLGRWNDVLLRQMNDRMARPHPHPPALANLNPVLAEARNVRDLETMAKLKGMYIHPKAVTIPLLTWTNRYFYEGMARFVRSREGPRTWNIGN